jgi:hypothetical protein
MPPKQAVVFMVFGLIAALITLIMTLSRLMILVVIIFLSIVRGVYGLAKVIYYTPSAMFSSREQEIKLKEAYAQNGTATFLKTASLLLYCYFIFPKALYYYTKEELVDFASLDTEENNDEDNLMTPLFDCYDMYRKSIAQIKNVA